MDYFISDTHFNHTNVIKYCNRPFSSIEEMNKKIINNWNNRVSKVDKVFFLGDFCLGKREDIEFFAKQLNGRKILIKGNHERGNNKLYLDAGFVQVYNYPIVYYNALGKKVILSHKPFEKLDEFINIHGHIHQYSVEKDNYYCVSVEHTNYKPVSLEEILEGKNYNKFLKGSE